MNTRAVGIIDSGLGGLSIWHAVREQLPCESIVYLADHAYLPYSEKSTAQIRKRIIILIDYLLKKSVKIIIIACNTATVAGIEYYRKVYPQIPIIGVVPVVKTAATLTKTNTFAVLSTEYTAKSQYQQQLIQQFAPNCNVFSVPCSSLIQYVEKGETDSVHITDIVSKALVPLLPQNIDVVVLGCTHFPFLHSHIRMIVGTNVHVIDSAPAVARHTDRILTHNRSLNSVKNIMLAFITTGDALTVSRAASLLLHQHLYFTHETL